MNFIRREEHHRDERDETERDQMPAQGETAPSSANPFSEFHHAISDAREWPGQGFRPAFQCVGCTTDSKV
jgi:hypothetical protein